MATITLPIDADLQRLRAEFLAMPGLRLTVQQAARLMATSVEGSAAMLATLEDEGLLVRQAGGVYRRAFPSLA